MAADTRQIRDLRKRLDALLDRWLKASPAERATLVLEKMRLEEALERAEREARAS